MDMLSWEIGKSRRLGCDKQGEFVAIEVCGSSRRVSSSETLTIRL
jgi:hypothetical protein